MSLYKIGNLGVKFTQIYVEELEKQGYMSTELQYETAYEQKPELFNKYENWRKNAPLLLVIPGDLIMVVWGISQIGLGFLTSFVFVAASFFYILGMETLENPPIGAEIERARRRGDYEEAYYLERLAKERAEASGENLKFRIGIIKQLSFGIVAFYYSLVRVIKIAIKRT